MQRLNTVHISGDPYQPCTAHVVDVRHETDTIVTLRLRFADPDIQEAWGFDPGQFNMLYLYGVGEVPISIASDPAADYFDHTLRVVGRVTEGLARLQPGDSLGVRGPFGRGWPLQTARGHDVVIISGGLGCAPTVAAITWIAGRRSSFGRLVIVQGIRDPEDMIYAERYDRWSHLPDTQVVLAASHGGPGWPGHVGHVTDEVRTLDLRPEHTQVMMCGPEGLMRACVPLLLERGIAPGRIWLSLERNMQCAVGHCGHCQYGSLFICRDGPVFSYDEISELFHVPGF